MADHLKLGQAGVLRVASELLLRRHSPTLPCVDDAGYDVMIDSGLKIQVKTARLHKRKNFNDPSYFFSLGWAQVGLKHVAVRRQKAYSNQVDYVVFFGVDEQRFWIVPAVLVDNLQCLVLGPSPRVQRDEAIAARERLGSLRAAGKELGVDHHLVARRISGNIRRGHRTEPIRQCEGRWDFLGPDASATKEALPVIEVDKIRQIA